MGWCILQSINVETKVTQTNLRRIIRLTSRPGAAEHMRRALIELQRETVAEPGCAEFEFLQSLTAPESFLLIEDFASPAALETHMQAPHTKAFFARDVMASGAPIEKAWMS
jgi:quinol monooxygenase YgiN